MCVSDSQHRRTMFPGSVLARAKMKITLGQAPALPFSRSLLVLDPLNCRLWIAASETGMVTGEAAASAVMMERMRYFILRCVKKASRRRRSKERIDKKKLLLCIVVVVVVVNALSKENARNAWCYACNVPTASLKTVIYIYIPLTFDVQVMENNSSPLGAAN